MAKEKNENNGTSLEYQQILSKLNSIPEIDINPYAEDNDIKEASPASSTRKSKKKQSNRKTLRKPVRSTAKKEAASESDGKEYSTIRFSKENIEYLNIVKLIYGHSISERISLEDMIMEFTDFSLKKKCPEILDIVHSLQWDKDEGQGDGEEQGESPCSGEGE